MRITVHVTKAELAEMECTEQELATGVLKTLDGRVEMTDESSLYLADVEVDLIVSG